jgi:hypothetical protein
MKNKNNVVEIEHINCDICKRKLTYLVDDNEEEIENDKQGVASKLFDESIRELPHFHITRNREEGLHFEDYDTYVSIEENEAERNVKSERVVCEECFTQILNESKTLGNEYKYENEFIY